MKLNPEQELVASHTLGRILTLAGPGSGKTRTLTERTGRLIRGGANPASLLCLTFTNKARDEMRDRITHAFGEAAKKVFISNFHGLCGMILRRLAQPMGYTDRLTVIDQDDQYDLIAQVARKRGLELTKPAAKNLAFVCNDWRENLGDADDLVRVSRGKLSEAELRVIERYVSTLRERNQCDFSGLLSETVRLLRDFPDVREKLQKKFRFIQVDEFQDTNVAQIAMVELITGPEDNVLAVGDGDQSIYAWRGASPDAIPNFIEAGKRKTGQCKVVKLGTNYRSTPQVVAVADKLIRHCADRIPVEFTTVHKDGEPVKCAKLPTPEDEANVVAMNIEAVMKSGTHPREIAVFYRTNDMSRLVEQSLAKRQIPYKVVGSGSYYDRMEVKDVLSMLRFLCNPKDGISFARVANKPARGMGDALVGRLEAFAERHKIDLMHAMSEAVLPHIRDENDKPLSDGAFKACRATRHVFDVPTDGHTVAEIANAVLDRSKYDDWLKDKYEEKEEYENRKRNVNELVNAIAEFCRTSPRASIADYLQSISLYTTGDDNKTDDAVRLMSLHASKGLEFDAVYMIGVEKGILPHEKAVQDRAEKGLDEERRLCYVGFTRARKILRVTWCEKRQDSFSRGPTARFKPTVPSRFLLEAGLITEDEYNLALKGARSAPPPPRPARPREKRT
ncbi:MAG TPA: UvrD-helicase domain-containing protein [Tepidisphaeraceae bacterium]|nr:UvrD-helicase domain-containing protein [Tepidisphaeraceae bacterium]